MKPECTHGLKAGRALGAQRGFVDTFNWMLNFCLNLRGMDGVTVDRNDSDHPIIRIGANATTAAELRPFTVRAYQKDPSDTSATRNFLGKCGWMIYLPPGCLSVVDSCEPMNRKMKDVAEREDGEDEDAFAARWRHWYDLGVDETKCAPRTAEETVPDGKGGTRSVTVRYYEFRVSVHAKTRARMRGVGELDTSTRRLQLATAQAERKVGGGEWTDEEKAYGRWGDEFAQEVAAFSIRVQPAEAGGVATVTREVRQFAREPISVAGRVSSGFDLAWYFEVDDSTGEVSVWKVFCIRASLSAAGITLSGPEMTEVTDAEESLYAKIKTNPLDKTGEGTVEVVMDPEGMTTDDGLTWLQLYSISHNVVEADWRAQSLVNVQVYR